MKVIKEVNLDTMSFSDIEDIYNRGNKLCLKFNKTVLLASVEQFWSSMGYEAQRDIGEGYGAYWKEFDMAIPKKGFKFERNMADENLFDIYAEANTPIIVDSINKEGFVDAEAIGHNVIRFFIFPFKSCPENNLGEIWKDISYYFFEDVYFYEGDSSNDLVKAYEVEYPSMKFVDHLEY